MDAFDRKNRPPPNPLEGLESPFLDQEIFAGQGEEEWEPRLGALEAASPFLSTFELSGAGSPPSGARREEEPPFPEPEAETEVERLFEAEGGITGEEDDRKEVRDTTIAPYRWICSVTYEKDGKTLGGGSGFLISNRHVLTAAHVISDKATAPTAHSVYVYPGRHYGGERFGRIPVAKARVSSSRFDFGLITLERPVDPAVQWWGHPSSKSVWWSEALIPQRELFDPGIPLSTAGYPSAKDRQRRRMYESNGATVPRAFAGVFSHTLETTEGQSGSPIWTVRNGLYVLVGIVTSYTTTGQLALWVQMVRGEVGRWMAEDAPKVQRRIALEIPYRWVCRLEVYDNDLRRVVGYGTGLLISDRHVLTSARVIHGFSRDRRRYSVRVTPGYEFGKEALGSTTASKARVSPRFSPGTNDASADYGVLTLSRPLGSATYPSIGNAALGSWGGPSHGLSSSAADWSGKTARLAAFSRSSDGGAGYHKLRVSSGGIVGLRQGQILHKAGSKLDAPGAPIWVEGGEKRLLVGIASPIFSKDSDVNWGCYLSQETLSHLMEWINEDFERKELEAGELLSQDELESLPATPGTEAKGPPAEGYPEQELQEAERSAGRFQSLTDDFPDASESAKAGHGLEPYMQQVDFHLNVEEYEDAALEDEDFTGTEEYEDESERFEEFVPKVSETDLRKRIDEHFGLANAEYTLPDKTKVRARPQFHIAKVGDPEQDAQTVGKILTKKFGGEFTKPLKNAIRCAAYGRARPDEIRVITQALIDAGELETLRSDHSGLSDDQLIRAMQKKFNIGIDCAGYVQLAFIFAFTGKHDDARCNLDSSKLREDLGFKARRSWENLAYLPKKHFTEVGFLNGQTGDLLVLAWRKGERDWHTVIVVEHTVSGDIHTFEVDASWGFLYGDDAAGVARRKFVHDRSAGKWWDIHPITGAKVNENSIGPYKEHPIKGMYRAKQK